MLQRVQQKLRQAVCQMMRRPELCCGAIVLICALLLPLTYTCGRLKDAVVVSAAPPVRFFPRLSAVLDVFDGDMEEVETLRDETDVSVIFYYAPWCAHSMAAREHVLQVALRLTAEVRFIAVNCWWHKGKCRKYKNFYQYPVIHLYYRRYGPIEYRAPVQTEYLEKFIKRFSHPLTYLPTSGALHSFLNHHQQGVVGYFRFNSSPQPSGYVMFLLSSLLALRRDPQGAVRFAVVTSSAVAEGVALREDESVYLHRRFQSSLVFPRHRRSFTPEAICDWIFENHESVVQWIQSSGAKSYSLEAELQRGPALLMFLPHHSHSSNQFLTQVSDVALRYHSCCVGCGCCVSVCVVWGVCEVCSGVCVVQELWTLLDQHLQEVPVRSGCRLVRNTYSPRSLVNICCRHAHAATPAPAPTPALDPVAGLRCRTNKTLRFYLLDSRLNQPLLQRLGAIDSPLTTPFITIINLPEHTHHVMNQSHTLEGFVQDFSEPYTRLRRHLQGQSDRPRTHSLIQEVTSHNFQDTVLDTEKEVLLLYYSGWCGFCSVLNHVFLHLARLFRGIVTVARVNVARNDLPWEFMVDRLPTIIYYPRHRKHMSVRFPDDMPVTLPNMLRFVLHHMSHTLRESLGAELRDIWEEFPHSHHVTQTQRCLNHMQHLQDEELLQENSLLTELLIALRERGSKNISSR